jgi:hypothetical protein
VQQLAGNESVFLCVLCACAAKNEFFSVLAKSLTVVGSERPFVRIGVSQITAHYPPITKRITLSSRPIHGEVSDSKLRREESK